MAGTAVASTRPDHINTRGSFPRQSALWNAGRRGRWQPGRSRRLEPEEHVEPVDASIINGGADMDPAHYGEDRAASTDEPDHGRDEFEFGVVGGSTRAVCASARRLSRAAGERRALRKRIQELASVSELEYHVADAYDQPVHALEIDRDSLIERDRGAEVRTSRRSTQAIDRLRHGPRRWRSTGQSRRQHNDVDACNAIRGSWTGGMVQSRSDRSDRFSLAVVRMWELVNESD